MTGHPSWPGAQGFPRMWDFDANTRKFWADQRDPIPLQHQWVLPTHQHTWRVSLGTSEVVCPCTHQQRWTCGWQDASESFPPLLHGVLYVPLHCASTGSPKHWVLWNRTVSRQEHLQVIPGLLTPVQLSDHPSATIHRIHFLETHPFPMMKERRPDSQIHKTIQAAMSLLLFLAHDHCVSKYKG